MLVLATRIDECKLTRMNDQAPISDWLTSGAACRILNVSRQRLNATVKARKIPFLRLHTCGFLYWRKAIEEERDRLEEIRANYPPHPFRKRPRSERDADPKKFGQSR